MDFPVCAFCKSDIYGTEIRTYGDKKLHSLCFLPYMEKQHKTEGPMRKAYDFRKFSGVSLTGSGTIQTTGEGNGAELTIRLYGDQFNMTDFRWDRERDDTGIAFTIFGEHEREAFIAMLCDYFDLQKKSK